LDANLAYDELAISIAVPTLPIHSVVSPRLNSVVPPVKNVGYMMALQESERKIQEHKSWLRDFLTNQTLNEIN
jgi:hypothetical protein